MTTIRTGKRREAMHMVTGLLEFIGALILMVMVAFDLGEYASRTWKMTFAVILIVGGSLSMHLAEHARNEEVSGETDDH